MSQSQIQVQKQEQRQELKQSIRMQQVLHSQLVELPLNQLLDRINTEQAVNGAIEIESMGDADSSLADYGDSGDSPIGSEPQGGSGNAQGEGDGYGDEEYDDYDAIRERDDRRTALDDALAGIGRDDEELPIYHGGSSNGAEEKDNIVYGAERTFYDSLREQMGEVVMSDQQKLVMEYLIGSLDDDGLLRKTADTIEDELAIFHNITTSAAEVEEVIGILQTFDPAGIGARDIQECLLLQIQRRDDSLLKQRMMKVVSSFFDRFMHNRWDKIRAAMKLSEVETEELQRELRKLNPRPGAALGETVGRNIHQITPDFIIDTNDDGTITFSLNNSEVPELKVSQSFIDMIDAYRNNREGLNRKEKEALLYAKQNVTAAQNFIEALKMRRQTLTVTMRAIIQWQKQYFADGDEQSLRPMYLKDIATKTGLDVSTISRVSNNKYAQTRWGIFPLRHFFSEGYTTENGKETSTRIIKAVLKEIVENEDKTAPYSDEQLCGLLATRGYPIARRTVTKYREQMDIPTARLRK